MRNNKLATFFFFFFIIIIIIFFLFSSSIALSTKPTPIPSFNQSTIQAVFAFGDSTMDSGNNDHLLTVMHANHLPYGRDLPFHVASGRFSNGKLISDFLVSHLGLKDLLPAYLDPSLTDQDLLTGVSFASGGTGLDDLTATISNVERMSTQLFQFQQAVNRIKGMLGVEKADDIVRNSLLVIGAGANDMLWNFYALKTRRRQFTVSNYQDFLLGHLTSVVQQLYEMGGRKIAVSGLPPMGCLPFTVTANSLIPGPNLLQRKCVQQQNLESQTYNAKLQDLISRLQATLPGSIIVYVDGYNPVIDMINHPIKYGLLETIRGCCGTGLVEMGPLCTGLLPACPDASRFVFWDAVHPTQATYQVLANIFLGTELPHLLS